MAENKLPSSNSFGQGMNLSISDLALPDSFARYMSNFRLVGLEGNNFVISNIKGTESKFSLPTGFIPAACAEFNNVLYIVSWKQSSGEIEVGSYPSPDYDNPSSGNVNVYRAFRNLNNSVFRTAVFGTTVFPKIQKLEVQPDYDASVNLCFTIVDLAPRIINSKFDNRSLAILPARAGTANSNTYTTSSVDKETHLQIFSDKILKMSLSGINEGGKLKCGNYVYVFKYMTEDFNATNIIGQSGVCQIALGTSDFTRKGGNETQETTLRTILDLSNIDTDFKYLKVFMLYSSGQQGVQEQYLEFTQPISITGGAMQFIHTGFEELREIALSDLNIDYTPIKSAATSAQVGNRYLLGNIVQSTNDYTIFKDAAANIAPSLAIKSLSSGVLSGYADPTNVYNYLGYFGKESYPFGIVFIMPGGVLSPVFPTKGRIINSQVISGSPSVSSYTDQANGIVTFPYSNHFLPYENNLVKAKYLEFDMSTVPSQVKDASIGFFFVRGERRPAMLTQGILIPTVRVPTMDRLAFTGEDDSNDNYWWDHQAQGNDTNVFKHLPCLDSLMEAYRYDRTGGFESDVIDGTNNQIKDGYMPIFVNDLKESNASYPEVWSERHWALLSGEALLNEPSYLTSLQRDNLCLHQLAKVKFEVIGNVIPKFKTNLAANTGLQYRWKELTRYEGVGLTTIDRLVYVPQGTFATGSEFISQISARLKYGLDGGTQEGYLVKQQYEAFFGLVANGLQDAAKGATNPIGGNLRIAATAGSNYNTNDDSVTSGPGYNNFGQNVDGAFLINIYPGTTIPTGAQLYPTIDGVVYKQVTPRYTWADVPGNNKIPVYGGDCYISKITRRLNKAPYTTKVTLNISNIDSGIMPEWYQESKYNLFLREPKQFDASESEERSFYPYKSQGNFEKYRAGRLYETVEHSQGYSRLLTPKSFFSQPSLSPFVKNKFFTRIMPSEKHIPNAFKNGYRAFPENELRDYDTAMGEIVALFNHRGYLLVVFEHGIGLASVDQRVETGSDAGSPISIEPSTVLPPSLSFDGFSREIGCQNHLSLIQTPQGIYGVDAARDKIWMVSDKLYIISDGVVDSFIHGNLINPRSGYDPENHEVIFTTDNYSLAYREGGAGAFYFLPFRPNFYARRGKEFYSFLSQQAHKHNAPVYTIYGETKESVIEFVINKNSNMTKILDWLHIVSNAVSPSKVETFTMKNPMDKQVLGIDTSAMNQYSKVDAGIDPITEEHKIVWRDKHFSLQVPPASVYNPVNDQDKWGIDGRMRNIYFIVRITYNTVENVRLAAVLSNMRYSIS